MPKHLHIVSFDIPYPPNYGGVIDIFFKCKALFELGVKIELHSFEYGRAQSKVLEQYCSKVYYYKRKRFVNPFLSALPYIVKSRIHKQLLVNLRRNKYPVLFEGLHTTWPIMEGSIDLNRCFVRTHNIEHEYYKRLEIVEKNPFKKQFFKLESVKLLRYEKVLKNVAKVFAISKFDAKHFSKINPNTFLVSAFHENNALKSLTGIGEYVLYHGNLSVGENDHAAKYLAAKVFPNIKMPSIIAGNKPSKELIKLCARNNIKLITQTDHIAIIELIQEAQVNVLPTFQKTGIKLKLLNALYQGKHCVVNKEMVEDTGLENLCFLANNAANMILIIDQLQQKAFNAEEINKRAKVLKAFDNAVNAKLLYKYLFT